tara:strand:+ start:32366 stop:33709 length:1344 start_codon:yes stop_codon:yes gene_type:complete
MGKLTIKDIVNSNLCVGCGVCISEANNSKMVWNEEGFLVPDITKEFNDNAIRVCPFNPKPDITVEDEDKLADLFLMTDKLKQEPTIGNYVGAYIGHSGEFRDTSSSGGLGTYIFQKLLEEGFADHLFVVQEFNGMYAYDWFEKGDNIKKTSKTRYFPVSLERLFIEIDLKDGKVAVSGIPSFIKAIRLKQYYYPEYRNKISFLVGIICGGIKSKFFSDYLAQKAGFEKDYTKPQYRIKDYNSTAGDYSFGAQNQQGVEKRIKMREVGNMWGTSYFNSNAYDFGSDVTAELADISLGDAWIKPYSQDGRGSNVIITRSSVADTLIQEGISKGELEIESISTKTLKLSQEGGIRHRQVGIKYRMKLQKNKGLLVPYVRKRILQNISFEYQLVQKKRMKMRQNSLDIWKECQNSISFDKKMAYDNFQLKILTRIYHKFQRLKEKLGFKYI